MTAWVKSSDGVLARPRHHQSLFMSAVTLTLASLATPVSAQQTRVENPYARDVEFTVTLRERQNLIGELPIHIAQDGSLSVQLTALAATLANRITPQATQILLALQTRDNRVSFESLNRLGYELVFNDADLDLAITIPLTSRPRQDYSVMGAQRGDVGDFDRVAGFSFAANLRMTGDYSHSTYDEAFIGSGTLGLLGRLGPLAYQSNYRIPSHAKGLLHEGSRFVIDDVKRAMRWQIGDIRPFSASAVGGDDLLGFGFSRETDTFQPDRIVRVRGTQTFSIEEPSEVTVSVNGRVVTRRMFAPGNYNIADFPFVLGRNQIDLTVLTQSGEQQKLSFNQFLDSRLLEAGRDDFGFAVGIASKPGYNQSRVYNGDDWILNAHYIKGVSEKLTTGFATTLSDQRRAVLMTGVYAGHTGIASGRIGLSVAATGLKFGTLGFGLVRTLSSDQRTQSNTTLRFALDSRVDLQDPHKSLINGSLGYAWPINGDLNASAEVRISGRNASSSFQTSYNLGRDLRLNVSLDWRFNKNPDLAGPGLSIGLSRSFGFGSQARASYDSRLEESRLSLTRTPESGLGLWSNAVEVARSGQNTSLTSAQSALFNRFDIASSVGALWQGKRSSQRLGASIGTALAFADGRLAWGRPVNDSFAIIGGHKSLGGRVISLDSRGSRNGPLARTGRFGPALISGLGTYSARVVSIAVEDPPDGYDIGSGTFRIYPPLFGGYSFIVGSDLANTVSGTLLLPNGAPASLIAGLATSADWPNVAPITVFTNAAGQFSATGLGEGRWSLKMRGLDGTFDFTIGAADAHFIDIGAIKMGDDK
jgi:outer membrane usher protein